MSVSLVQKIEGVFNTIQRLQASVCSKAPALKAPISDLLSDACGYCRKLLEAGQAKDCLRLASRAKAFCHPVENLDLVRAMAFMALGQEPSAIEALKEELRYFPDNGQAKFLLAGLENATQADIRCVGNDHEFQELYRAVRPYTMVGIKRLYALYSNALKICKAGAAGNFVECGVAAGGSSALLAAVLKRYGKSGSKLFSFDTFGGMPSPCEKDRHGDVHAEETGWGSGTCAAPVDSLLAAARALGAEDLVTPVPGLFEETLPRMRESIKDIAFLHMDGDWYKSTMDILIHLYDQVVPGGYIQVDDYGYWEGCRNALHEFAKERSLKLALHPIDETGVWFLKP